MSGSKIVVIVTGSIAAYKACEVVSDLVQRGHQVRVVATASALRFVGATTFEGLTGQAVLSDLFAAGAALVFVPAIGEYVIPALLGGPQAQLIGKVLWEEFFANRDWPTASAVAICLLAVLIAVPVVLVRAARALRVNDRDDVAGDPSGRSA